MFAAGDIVLVSFPFAEGTTAKQRPAIVLKKLEHYDDFLALPVTTKSFHDHTVIVESAMIERGSLPKTSWIRYDKIATLNSSQVLGRVATLNGNALKALTEMVCQGIGCR